MRRRVASASASESESARAVRACVAPVTAGVQHNRRARCTQAANKCQSRALAENLPRRSTGDGGPPPRSPFPHEALIGVGEENRHCINAPICPLFQIPFVFPNETMSLRRNCVIAALSLPSSHCVHRCLAWPSRLIIRTMHRDNTVPLRWTRR